MTDVFKRTAQVLEKERQLLDRDPALFGPLEAPVEDIPPVAIDHADLVAANANFQPGSLPPETRRRRLKETALRLISVYSSMLGSRSQFRKRGSPPMKGRPDGSIGARSPHDRLELVLEYSVAIMPCRIDSSRAVLELGLSFAILTPGDFLRRLVGGSE